MDGIGAVNRHPDTILFCCPNLQLQSTSIAASYTQKIPCLPMFDCHFSRISQLTNVKIGVNALYYKRLYQNKTSENAIFPPISPFIRKKRLEITIIKRKEENIQLSILIYHQSAHITLHFIKSVISKWYIRLLKWTK